MGIKKKKIQIQTKEEANQFTNRHSEIDNTFPKKHQKDTHKLIVLTSTKSQSKN